MKRTLLHNLIALLLFCMLAGTLAACNPTPDLPEQTQPDSTDAPEQQPTDTDTPKTDAYVTTTDLVLPDYTYAKDDQNNNGILPATRDVFADTWVATDGANRSLPDAADTKDPSANLVGIFYFLWRDRDQSTISEIPASDHYAAYLEGGVDKLYEVMQEGGEGHPHYWAEPYFGYYSSNDEWVLRKHAYMLAEAGVDFVYFDITNNNTHQVSYEALLKVWEEVRQEGYAVPKIVFLCGAYDAEFAELWQDLYEPGLYEDLWMYWEGKPLLMLTDDVAMTEEQKDFFTIRYSWAIGASNWYAKRKGTNCWAWSGNVQSKGYGDNKGDFEQMYAMCGFWATNMFGYKAGRSWANNRVPEYEGDWNFGYAIMDTATGLGLAFDEQFEKVYKNNPPVLMLTGWNEWIAGRWSGAGAGAAGVGQILAGEYHVSNDPNSPYTTYFVDQFNPEYSRDLEPMKGGFGDNYLYQTAKNLRTYKGTRQIESAFGQWAIDINGSVGQWYAVGPEFRDYEGDIVDRTSPGHVGGNENGMYVNFSGRNDIVTAKVSSDSSYLYFYVECADDITAPEGNRWMNLFINADCNDATGWYGYDFMINRSQKDGWVSVERFVGTDTWEFESVGSAKYSLSGNVLQIKVSKQLIGVGDTFDFKWADNSVPTGEIMEFLDQGDAAPNGRYNYRYTTLETETKLPDVLTEDMVVLKSRSYNAFVGGQSVRLVKDNTLGVLLASNEEIYLPVSFLESLGYSCEGAATYNHYGMQYVQANGIIESAGKQITLTSDGLVVIADELITDEDILRILYRSLN
ncbi:MAG: hypothetical protein IJW70_02675 [Clostridia bacterium]|nr:hypothetical protein [Clostridia bacterium]